MLTEHIATLVASAASAAPGASKGTPGPSPKDVLDTVVAIVQILASIAVVVTGWVAIVTLGRQRRTWAAESLWDFQKEWEGARMHAVRAETARFLLRERLTGRHRLFGSYLRVLNFFEVVGFLVRRRAIPADEAWVWFSDAAKGYWLACESRITLSRKADSTIHEELAYLHVAFEAIDRQRHVPPYAEADIRKFLAYEAALAPSGPLGRLWERIFKR